MNQLSPLVLAWQLDATGGGRRLDWLEITTHPLHLLKPCWLHLNRNSEAARQWLQQRSGLDPFAIHSLLAKETRPRCLRFHDGVILTLRGVNQNLGAAVHDMPTLRLWLEEEGMLTLRGRRMLSPEDVDYLLESRQGPRSSGEFIVALLDKLTTRIEEEVELLGQRLEELEKLSLTPRPTHEKRRLAREYQQQLALVRSAAVTMRRYLVPQREAIHRLASEELAWIGDGPRRRLNEIANDHHRFIEELDELRDTAGIFQDQLATAISDVMNDLLYKLTLISAFLMPLSFLAGFFGSNTGGMLFGGDPADPTALGALYETLLILGVAILELLLLRWLKWL